MNREGRKRVPGAGDNKYNPTRPSSAVRVTPSGKWTGGEKKHK